MCRQRRVLGVLGVWSLANGRLECPNKRGLCAGKGQAAMLECWRPGTWWKLPRGMCRQRAGCNPGAAKADGQAWWKLPRTFKARAEGLAQVKPAQAPSRVWCPHGRQRTGPAVFIRSMTWTATTGMRERLLWPWKTKFSAGKLTCPKHIIFMSKCLEIWTGGWRMPGEGLRDVVWPWKAKKEKFHTCGGPRRRPGLGEGRGRRIYMYIYI